MRKARMTSSGKITGMDGEIDYTGRLGIIERLEHEIQRRLDRKNMRKSPITLFELITEFKNIEKEERRRRRMAADPRRGVPHRCR